MILCCVFRVHDQCSLSKTNAQKPEKPQIFRVQHASRFSCTLTVTSDDASLSSSLITPFLYMENTLPFILFALILGLSGSFATPTLRNRNSTPWRFPYDSQKVRGVNLGGWLVLEVCLTAARFALRLNSMNALRSLGWFLACLEISTRESSTNGPWAYTWIGTQLLAY